MSCHCDLLFFNKTFLLVFPVRNRSERDAFLVFGICFWKGFNFQVCFAFGFYAFFSLLQNSEHFSLFLLHIISDCGSRLRVHTLFVVLVIFELFSKKSILNCTSLFDCQYILFALNELNERLICIWKWTSL